MNRVSRACYTYEFREAAVTLAKAVGASEASRRLSIPLKSLANRQRAGKLEEVGRQQRPQTEPEAELQRAKRALAEVKMERDLPTTFEAYLRANNNDSFLFL